jgi:hypothetical protein
MPRAGGRVTRRALLEPLDRRHGRHGRIELIERIERIGRHDAGRPAPALLSSFICHGATRSSVVRVPPSLSCVNVTILIDIVL